MSSSTPEVAGTLTLRIEGGPAAGREIRLVALCSVGRDAANGIVLQDSHASRHHADIYPAQGNFCVADAGSANGTSVNGQRIETPVFIYPGDLITVGSTQLRVVAIDPRQPASPAPRSTGTRKTTLLVVVALVGVGIVATAVFFAIRHGPTAARSLGSPGSPILESREKRGLFGSYLFEVETGGTKPASDAEIVIKFIPPDRVTIRAVRPGEVLTDVGSFSTNGDRITIELPELDKRAQAATFTYDGKRLVLPFKIIGEGDGTSEWSRIGSESEPDPLNDAIERYYVNVRTQERAACLESLAVELKSSPTVADAVVHDGKILLVTYRSGYREFFLAPALGQRPEHPPAVAPEGVPPPEELELPMSRHLPQAGEGQYLFCSASYAPRIMPAQFLPGGPGGQGLFNPRNRFEAWLEPEPEPASHGDAPASKTALILAPYQNLPILIPGSKSDHYSTFGEYGEDPGYIAAVLKKAGYEVEGPHLDQQVTVKRLYELMKDRSLGVLYFSTHGGDVGSETILSLGQQIPAKFNESPKTREKYLKDTVTRDLGADAWPKLKGSLMVGCVYNDVPFISITNSFFRAVNLDLSAGLAYMSGCDTAMSPYLRDSMRARSFVGWKSETHMELTGDMSKAFWRCLDRKTRSDREAMDWGINYLLGAKGYDEKLKVYGATYDPKNLVVYRAGRNQPEARLTGPQHLMLYTCRAFALRKRAAGNPEDLPGIASQLYVCNEEDQGTGLGANPFCRDALNGVTFDRSVIDEVKGELCGYGGTPARFTLVEK